MATTWNLKLFFFAKNFAPFAVNQKNTNLPFVISSRLFWRERNLIILKTTRNSKAETWNPWQKP